MQPTDPATTGGAGATPQRTRPLDETPALAQQAVDFLSASRSLFALSADEARQIVRYLRLVSFAPNAKVFREGDDGASSFMLLILEGEVTVDAGPGEVPIAAIGSGSIIGEMSLLDGSPRSATCTAMSPVRAAGLSRRGLELLLEEHPKVAAKLIASLSQRIAERLRGLGAQLQLYADLNAQLRAELDALKSARR